VTETACNTGNLRLIGYLRVSTEEQADSGAGLQAQRRAIRNECQRSGYELVGISEDAGSSGKSLRGRPALNEALAAIERGEADGLIVAKLDRLSRSLLDFATLMERSTRQGWTLIALDLGVDTHTPSGEMLANVLAVFAQFERRLISQRTREALAVRKEQGVRLGRPQTLPGNVRTRIRKQHRAGNSYSQIARHLNNDAIPTAHGGKRWYPATVRKIILASR
jgi:DNA invertase Pin-like site-specific DNA recombinase